MRLLCLLGLHRWTSWLHTYFDPELGFVQTEEVHACKHCGKPRKKI